MREVMEGLSRWPLLATGLTLIVLALALFTEGDDKSDALALLLGVGCVLVGAGIVRVVEHDPDPEREGRDGGDPAP